MSTDKLASSRVVIIGGSSGIGLATAKLCISKGVAVTIASRSETKLNQARETLGNNVQSVTADITDPLSLEQLFAGCDPIDHIFLSAGYPVEGKLIDSDIDHLKRGIDQHIWAPIHIAKFAVSKMNAQSSIVFMSGQYSSTPSRHAPMTAVSFAALEMLTRVLTLELAPIRVNAIAPGIIDTPLLGGDRSGAVAYGKTLPVKRMGIAEEVAEAVVLLMNNGFITGEVLHIDGGGRYV